MRTIISTGLIFLCFLSSCSLFSSYSPTPEVKITVINISADYLQNIINHNPSYVASLLFPDKYFNSSTRSIQSFNNQFNQIQNHWEIEQHPLTNLKVIDVSVDENDAEVIFKKPSIPSQPNISVKLKWVGNAWLIVDDSIFGKGNLFDKLLAESPIG